MISECRRNGRLHDPARNRPIASAEAGDDGQRGLLKVLFIVMRIRADT